MILMDLQLDNLRGFRNFHLNTACPKEAAGSVTFDAHLSGRPDFRYRKTVLILGANGTGKTAIGLMLRDIFDFICRKDAACLAGDITDKGRPAVCQIDFVPDESHDLYRMRAVLTAPEDGTIASDGIQATVTHVPIRAGDSYETCIARLDEAPDRDRPWTAALDGIPFCSWYLARDSHTVPKGSDGTDEEDAYILETVLSSIDPCIRGISAIPGTHAAYLIHTDESDILLQGDALSKPDRLSHGAGDGLKLADMLTWLIHKQSTFFYCDELMARLSPDLAEAFASVMAAALPTDGQIFLTTQRWDLLDLPWPLQSFLFLKRDARHPDRPVFCLWASDVLPHETDSLPHTADRNRFSSSPPLDKVYVLASMASGNKDGKRTINFDKYGYKTERGQHVDEYMREMRDNDRI